VKHLGDFDASAVVYGKFTTFRPSTGATFTLAGTPALSVYKDNSVTQSTTGVTLTADFDSVTGLNHFAIDTSADGTFYSAGSFFDIVITTGTVDGVSVTGSVVAGFTIRKNSALKPTTAGRTLVVDASGLADANAVKLGPTGAGTAQTARDIGTSVLISSGTGTGQLDVTSGVIKANLAQILGTALTETAGLLAGGFKKFFNVSSPTGTLNSIPDAVAGAAGGLFIAGTNAPVTITGSGDALTLTSTGGNGTGLKASGNGSGHGIQGVAGLVGGTAINGAITGNLNGSVTGSVGSVTGAVGSVTGAVGSVTGNVGGNVTGSTGSVVGAVGSVTGNVGGNVVGSVASVTAGVTVTTNNDKTGYAMTSAYDFAKGTTAMTESYAANGVAPTPVQAILGVHQFLMQFGISGTSYTVKKLDNATTAFTATLDDATSPSGLVRT
jgi:hypothetical protein